MDFKLLWNRIVRAAKLDVHLYEEVEADRGALGQAALVVVLSSLAAGVGGAAEGGIPGLLVLALAALAGWFIWAWLIWIIGTKLLPEPQTSADTGEMLRTLGFAASPGLIRFLGVIPALAVIVNIIAGIWMLVATITAVRQALDYRSTWRAVGVCLVGWIVQILVLAVVFAALGVGVPR
ncbi:YIP1 family protein [Desulfuromonas sp. TF]|jgi:hypothetical protein|uniref:YIP1 family protein n=1 Tax=Desulfuromonas sp. TF TaxID=1232410 RepID=UPI000409DA83|nr:YIP1 family protein [Desulfuromonas sp. TF]